MAGGVTGGALTGGTQAIVDQKAVGAMSEAVAAVDTQETFEKKGRDNSKNYI